MCWFFASAKPLRGPMRIWKISPRRILGPRISHDAIATTPSRAGRVKSATVTMPRFFDIDNDPHGYLADLRREDQYHRKMMRQRPRQRRYWRQSCVTQIVHTKIGMVTVSVLASRINPAVTALKQ